MKKVKDLQEALSKLDPELPVAIYVNCGEDIDFFHEVRLETQENKSYCKGDHVLDFTEGLDKVVVIG